MFYKLDENKNVIPCSAEEWSSQLEQMVLNDTKHVKKEDIGDYWVSTVWLGLDHNYFGGSPLVFETMIQGPKEWMDYQERYSTWQEAEEGHKRAVQWVKDGCKNE